MKPATTSAKLYQPRPAAAVQCSQLSQLVTILRREQNNNSVSQGKRQSFRCANQRGICEIFDTCFRNPS